MADVGGNETVPQPALDPERDCECRQQLLTLFAERGIEMAVSALPPLVPSPYEDLGLRCPHGTRWYTEPTSDQQLAWAAAAGSGPVSDANTTGSAGSTSRRSGRSIR